MRELRNVIERAVVSVSGECIEAEDLDRHHPARNPRCASAGPSPLEAIEAEHIRRVVANTRTLEEAATILGIDPATLYRKRKKL